MNKRVVASTLRFAADEIGGEQTPKAVLDNLLQRTRKAEDLLAFMAELYTENRSKPENIGREEQMDQTAELLRVASRAIAEVWSKAQKPS